MFVHNVLDITLGPWRFVVRHLGKRYQVRYRFNRKHLVADVLLASAALGLIVANIFIFLAFTKWTVSLQVRLAVEVPTEIRSGEPVDVVVRYANTARQGLVDDAVLSVTLPQSFVLQTSSDARFDSQTGQLVIGALPAGSGGELHLSGEVWQSVGTPLPLTVDLRYRQYAPVDNRLSWRDDKAVTKTGTVIGSAVRCAVNRQAVVAVGSPSPYSVTCTNGSARTFSDLSVHFTTADGQAVVAGPGVVDQRWAIGALAPGTSATMSGTLTWQAAPADAELTAELTGTVGDRALVLERLPTAFHVLVPHVSWAVVTNDQGTYAPVLGETLTYQLTLTNDESFALEQPVVAIRFDDERYRLDSLTASFPHTLAGRLVTFDALDTLGPGESATIAFTVGLGTELGSAPYHLRFVPQVTYQATVDGQSATVTAVASALEQPLSARVTVSTLVRYYTPEGEQLGIGPIPPVVGIPTKYRAIWRVETLPNAIRDVTVTATLPDNVRWTGEESVSAGAALEFHPKTRTLTWRIPRVDVGASVPATAAFALEITPLVSQIGRVVPLVNTTTATATDAVTSREVSAVASPVSTDLRGDPLIQGRSAVVSF